MQSLDEQLFAKCQESFNAEAVAELLAQGANPNYRDPESGLTCLHTGLRWQYTKTLKLLIDAGADVNARLPDGTTLLHHAVSVQYPASDKIELLLKSGADVNAARINAEGQSCETPLHCVAREQQSMDTITQLLRAGADPRLVDESTGKIPFEEVSTLLRGMQARFHYFHRLPRLDMEQPVTREALTRKDGDGKSPLDNPVTWVNLPHVAEKLQAQGERWEKEDLLGEDRQGTPHAQVAVDAHALKPFVQMLNARGEALHVSDFFHTPSLRECLNMPEVREAIFSLENQRLGGEQGLIADIADLPKELRNNLRDAVPNYYSLRTALQREELAQVKGAGRLR